MEIEDGETTTAKAGPIDWSILAPLRALRKPGLPDPRLRVIEIYLKSASGLMAEIRKSIAASDSSALMKASHSLKSASMNIGATGLFSTCNSLERIGRAGAMEEVGELGTILDSEYEAVVSELIKAQQENEEL